MLILSTFNNREIALIIWMIIIFIFILLRKEVRQSVYEVLQAFLHWKILSAFIAMFFYICLSVHLLHKANIWNIVLTKDTIFWFVGTGMILFINMGKISKGESYFKKILQDTFAFVVVLTFIVNLYTFNLIIEFILLPILLIFGGLRVVSDTKDEYESIKKLLDLVILIFGIFLILFAFNNITDNFQGFATTKNLVTFTLPLLLTLNYLPFLYFLGLILGYENLFTRIDIFLKRDKALARFMKRKVFINFNINLSKLTRLANDNSQKITRLNNKREVIELLKEYDSNSSIKWGFVLRWVLLILSFLLFVRLFWFAIFSFEVSFAWTGFGAVQMPNGEIIRGKTLWDWMELVLIPLVLFFGAHYFSSVQRSTELEQTKLKEQASILQNYFDRMQDLILNHELLNDKTNDAVTVMALVLTRTTLVQLEPENKLPLLQFLDGTGLITPTVSGDIKVSLSSTSLTGVGLPIGYENGNFQHADFRFADMTDARFDLSDFSHADLMGVHLESANLMLCDLRGANLNGAFLKGANFYNSTFSEGTIMPNGENWHQDIDWNKFGVVFKDPYTDDEYKEILRELGHEH